MGKQTFQLFRLALRRSQRHQRAGYLRTAAIFGHAVGDAIGVPVEFLSRQTLQERPIDDMLGYGSHHVPKGTWSDDTSMTLSYFENIKFYEKYPYGFGMNFCDYAQEVAALQAALGY